MSGNIVKTRIIRSFIFDKATSGKTPNMHIENDVLYSYNTRIAMRTPAGITLNIAKYSQTTSAQQKLIRYFANEAGLEIKEIYGDKF